MMPAGAIHPIGLDRHGLGEPAKAPGIDTNRRQSRRAQLAVEPTGQPANLQADLGDGLAERGKPSGDRLRLGQRLAFADNEPALVDDADRRLLERDVEADIVLHVHAPATRRALAGLPRHRLNRRSATAITPSATFATATRRSSASPAPCS
jgi:hypothetical protein